MTVDYRDDPFGSGLIDVRQEFVAWNFLFTARITFMGTLRVSLHPASPENPDRIRFAYTFTFVRAGRHLVPLPPLVGGEFEDRFRSGFVEPFRARLGPAIADAIKAAAREEGVPIPDALLGLLQEVRITNREFILGFCIPAPLFPRGSRD
jgi:hypothetical protein